MATRICKSCGKEFEPRPNQLYCHGKCFRRREREYSNNHRAKFSDERRRAHVAAGCALAAGKLIRQPCEVCGSGRYVEAHHDDYAKPLDVRWLCKSHHRQHHHKFGPGKNAFCEEASA